jgi:DNA-binding transcriptional LysR family regulator
MRANTTWPAARFDALERRELKRVLPEWQTPPTPLHVVYPSATLKTKRVAAVIDFLGDALRRVPGFEAIGDLRAPRRDHDRS